MNVIEVQHLVKSYKTVKAVNDISFTVQEGQIFDLLGPNGAGKTTTIECMIGLQSWDSGRIKVFELDPIQDARKLYHLIGVQLQEASYQDKVKVYELCEFFLQCMIILSITRNYWDDSISPKNETRMYRSCLGDKSKKLASSWH